MGLIVSILKPAGSNCSAGGVSARYENLTLVNVDGPFEPTADRPAAYLKGGNLPGTAIVVPEENTGKWSMMGGCYVATSDSRFGDAVEKIIGARFYGAVPLHDRVE